MSMRRLFTLGYEGRTLDDFLGTLKRAKVRRVVDVRKLPLSRRRGFSKTKLSQALGAAGIEYVHLKNAGNPHLDLRHDVERCLQAYRRYIDAHPEVIEELEQLTGSTRAALLCVEAKAESCHRSILVDRLDKRGVPLKVQHL